MGQVNQVGGIQGGRGMHVNQPHATDLSQSNPFEIGGGGSFTNASPRMMLREPLEDDDDGFVHISEPAD